MNKKYKDLTKEEKAEYQRERYHATRASTIEITNVDPELIELMQLWVSLKDNEELKHELKGAIRKIKEQTEINEYDAIINAGEK